MKPKCEAVLHAEKNWLEGDVSVPVLSSNRQPSHISPQKKSGRCSAATFDRRRATGLSREICRSHPNAPWVVSIGSTERRPFRTKTEGFLGVAYEARLWANRSATGGMAGWFFSEHGYKYVGVDRHSATCSFDMIPFSAQKMADGRE